MYIIKDCIIGTQPITDTSTTQNHPLGTIIEAFDPTYGAGRFIYLKGVANTVAGDAVTYNLDDGTTTLLAANAIGPVAWAMSSNNATTSYGWYQIHGKVASGNTSAAVADDGNLYASTGPGKVDDAVVAGDRIWGAKAASSSTGAGTIEIEIAWPFVNDGVNAGT